MSYHDDSVPLRHMLDDARRALELVRRADEGAAADRHLSDLALQRLVTGLGDMATRVSAATRARQPEVDWERLQRASERVRSDYDRLDAEELRADVGRTLPTLVAALERVVAAEAATDSSATRAPVRSAGPAIHVESGALADLSRRYRIRRLALFGSVLREDFGPTSDVDVLVEFEPGYAPGLAFFRLQDDLARLLGREVDLVTRNSLSPYLRERVLAEAAEVFVAA
jgi:hypothetical protein